jgi:hypothetical protein
MQNEALTVNWVISISYNNLLFWRLATVSDKRSILKRVNVWNKAIWGSSMNLRKSNRRKVRKERKA